MSFRKNQKGQIRVIEAFFGSVLLLSCLALVPLHATPQASAPDLSRKAQNIISALDGDGQLASLIDSQNWDKLLTSFEATLALTTWFNLTVYNANNQVLNPYPISNGGPISNKIQSFTYICVSQSSNYCVYFLRLQLAVLD